ncbi:MAG: ABC transporter substrate-binding protein, partial [Alphaproteobacteria bacterium]|nr:ABC transporter substrate-binding protein [Alphaproteobacteria bacterium]
MRHRSKAGRSLAAAMLLLAVAGISGAASAQSAGKTIRFIAQADLRSLDPIWTTAYITRNYGYMVYDTLLAVDKNLKPQPQMVESWTESEDKLAYTFTLRPGLKWHDGLPVTPADCIASIARWGKRDALGQKLMEAVDWMKPAGERAFTIALKAPFPLLLEGLAKLSSNTPFMMPERVAKTDAFQQISESVGSGPFKFVKEEWVPGNKAVFVKNGDYVPRQEPPSFAAGGKVVKVDRVEWLYIPDAATAVAALNAGEADWYEQPPSDLIPIFQANPDIVVANVDPLGSHGILRFNFIQPPFNNKVLRQAVLALVDQKDYMRAVAGDEKNWQVCVALFVCGTPLATDAGGEQLKKGPDLAKAKQLIAQSGYKGEKIVVISATDQSIVNNQAQVTAQILKEAGLNVELQANDWGTLITRRAGKEPVEKGGWSIFHTWVVAPDLLSPAVDNQLRTNGDGAWFGWPSDATIEGLRDKWFKAQDLTEQKK